MGALISPAFCPTLHLSLNLRRNPSFISSKATSRNPVPLNATASSSTIDTSSTVATEHVLSPVLILPGLGNSKKDYEALADLLVHRGHLAVAIAPVQRWQWSLNAKGFFTTEYWRNELKPKSVLDWYFEKVDDAVTEIMEQCGSTEKVNILGHSAGGWLGRAYLAENAPSFLNVSTFLTLGTPHVAPPRGSADQSRGLLRYIEENCDITDIVSRFVCVAGRGTTGKPLGEGSLSEFLAFLSYAAVCGRGNVDGDGVIPVEAACARHGEAVYCENCDHSMLTSNTWYGSQQVFSDWVQYLT